MYTFADVLDFQFKTLRLGIKMPEPAERNTYGQRHIYDQYFANKLSHQSRYKLATLESYLLMTNIFSQAYPS